MTSTVSRVATGVALVMVIALLVRATIDVTGEGDASTPQGDSRAAPASGAAPAHETSGPSNEASRAAPASSSPLPPPLPRVAAAPAGVGGETPVHLLVRAPAFVATDAGGFDASVHIAAPDGVHRLRFAVAYDRRTLALSGVSPGDFARRGGVAADLVADEPSDGNVEVTFTLRDGRALAGTGTVAVLHFEPRRRNAVTITVSDVTAFDTTGAVRFRADAPQSATVQLE